jgi:hypothetical protein
MGRSWADFGGNENTLKQNTLAAENRDITKRIAVNECNRQAP